MSHKEVRQMEKGYDVFGRAYGIMLRNDLHSANSIDHRLIEEMVLLTRQSYACLYASPVSLPENINEHELYPFAQQFRDKSARQTIENILKFCSEIACDYNVPFEQMLFGGTEMEILCRGTDWCADMARVGAVLLMCCDIPARIVHLANTSKAYNGHVVCEAYYEGKYGICDFIYGYCMYDRKPLDAFDLMQSRRLPECYGEDYASLYTAAAISEYNPMADNCYAISSPNQYYVSIINSDHQGRWLMGEDE